jgi:hypothetical protein
MRSESQPFQRLPYNEISNRRENLTNPRHLFRSSERMPASTRPPPRSDFPLADRLTEEDFSIRLGRTELQNVTERETKRQHDRPKDLDYKRRFSVSDLPVISVSLLERSQMGQEPLGETAWPRESRVVTQHLVSSELGRHGSVKAGRINFSPVAPSVPSPGDSSFWITLTHAGQTVNHHVWEQMPEALLAEEAGSIFGLDPEFIVLMLFSTPPQTLDKLRTIAGPPRIFLRANVFVFFVGPCQPVRNIQTQIESRHPDHGTYPQFQHPLDGQMPDLGSAQGPSLNSKLLGTFKLPKFDGSPRHWKAWEKGFARFLGLHLLDHVLEADFLLQVPLSQNSYAANKIVFFLLEDAVSSGSMAAKYVRQASKHNGHEAYMRLWNGYVFSGPQTATILLGELSHLRLLRDESPSAFCLRLVELIEDLELIPGPAAVFMGDTQKLGYLLTAIRHEKDLQSVCTQIQSDQLRGKITFEQACLELHHRCDAIRADEILDTTLRSPGKSLGLLSTEKKRHNRKEDSALVPCLSKECLGKIVSFLPFCKACYLQCMAGKTPVVELKDGPGNAKYNPKTMRIEFPASVPSSRLPQDKKEKSEKGLVAHLGVYLARPLSSIDSSSVLFYVDSGAGQCHFSCSSVFAHMTPCRVEIVVVSGLLEVFG